MSYHGRIPGPLPGPLGKITRYPWYNVLVAGQDVTPPPPEAAPEEVPPGAPEQAPEPPPPKKPLFGSDFLGRYKAFLIAGGLVAGYVWWRGRKR